MKRRILRLTLVTCFILAVTALFTVSASAETYGDLTYTVSNGEITITDCSESATSVTIPSKINGYPVTSIGYDAFRNCTSLTSISIPDSVTSIGDRAFYNCTSLTHISIGDSVTSIGIYAFYNCTSLTSVNITDIAAWCKISFNGNYSSPLYYAKKLYLNSTQLTDLTIPDSVTSIRSYAFYNYTSLTSISIPDSVTSIGSYAFCNCTSLTHISIPDSVTSIGSDAFRDCTSLTHISIGDSVTSIGSYAFYNCSRLTHVNIPDSVTSIGDYAFRNCTSLTHISIPNSVTSIGRGAFYNCSSLTHITVDEGNRVYHSNGNCLIKTNSKTLISGCKNSVIPTDGSVTSIGTGAFYGCTSLTHISIPDSVTSIGDSAFYNCMSLTHISIPDSVTSIGSLAFHICSKLKTVYYCGTAAEWNGISIVSGNTALTSATREYHKYTWTTTTEPTCTENGSATELCEFCGETKGQATLPALGHSYSDWNILAEPTPESEGFRSKVCSACGDEVFEIIYFASGDVDGDGTLTNADLSLAIRTLSGWTTDGVISQVDINYDGKINNRDIIALVRKLAGID